LNQLTDIDIREGLGEQASCQPVTKQLERRRCDDVANCPITVGRQLEKLL